MEIRGSNIIKMPPLFDIPEAEQIKLLGLGERMLFVIAAVLAGDAERLCRRKAAGAEQNAPCSMQRCTVVIVSSPR